METQSAMRSGDPVLEEAYSVATGTVLTINTKTKKLYNGDQELIDISKAFTPQKVRIYQGRWIIRDCISVKSSRHLQL
jgi:aconitase B